jgi:hypothetical protein
LVAKLQEMGEEHQRRLIWQRATDAGSNAAAGENLR